MSYKLVLGKRPEECNVRPKIRGKYYICAMIRDEHPYIREWALYHRRLGFDKIVLYDDHSSQSYDDELGDMMRDGVIEMRSWKGNQWSRQSRAYNDFVWSGDWQGDEYAAFIDIDEFLSFDDSKNVAEFMRYYEEFAGVGLKWRLYNANGRIKAPVGISTVDAYTQEFDYYEPSIKVIGRLKDIQFFPTVHHFKPLRGRLVTTNNHTILSMSCDVNSFCNGHIKHFITKSWEDWVRRLKRGNITRGLRTVKTFFDFNPDLRRYEKELIEGLDLSQFPTIGSENRIWDGEL